MIIDLFLYDAEVLRVRYRMCDELNSMQIIQESSILLDRTPTTFKLQWRFNFQLLRPDQRRDAFFRASRTFCAKCKLCVFSCHLNDEKGVQTKLAAKLQQSSPWRCRRTSRLSSCQLDAFQLILRVRGAADLGPVYYISIDRGRSGAPTGSSRGAPA